MTYTMAGAWSHFCLRRRDLWGLVLSDARCAEISLPLGESEYRCSVSGADNVVTWRGTASSLDGAKAMCAERLALEATR